MRSRFMTYRTRSKPEAFELGQLGENRERRGPLRRLIRGATGSNVLGASSSKRSAFGATNCHVCLDKLVEPRLQEQSRVLRERVDDRCGVVETYNLVADIRPAGGYDRPEMPRPATQIVSFQTGPPPAVPSNSGSNAYVVAPPLAIAAEVGQHLGTVVDVHEDFPDSGLRHHLEHAVDHRAPANGQHRLRLGNCAR